MDKSSARAPAADEASTLKPRPAHPPTRPPTKSAAPRLSTGTRPTTTAATPTTARPATTSSLSKPPARPPTTSTVRTARTTPSTTVPAHQKRQSASSIDEKPSGDEKSKDGISARPKRMSLAASTTSERTPAVSARRTTLQPSTTRQSTTSPTGVRKAPSTPSTTRTLTSSRTKPLASSVSRNIGAGAGTVGEKKRLSTIPASPAIKSDLEHDSGDNKENLHSDVEKKPPTRPALGTRKSTRSVLIEQQIREFELVNSMLQQAIAADGVDDQEQQSINEEAATSIAKLKADLAKVRQFERDNGRLPTETELDDVPEIAAVDSFIQDGGQDESKALNLQHELTEKQAEVESLHSELLSLRQKLEEFSKSAKDEASRVQAATEAIRTEHVSKIDELSALQEQKLKEMSTEHQNELEGLHAQQKSELVELKEQLAQQVAERQSEATRLESELESLRSTTLKEQSEKDAEIETLKLDLKAKTVEVETASNTVPPPSPSPDHAQKLTEAQEALEAAQTRHLAAKDNAKTKIAKMQEEFEAKLSTLNTQHEGQLNDLKAKLDKAELDVATKAAQIAKQSDDNTKINGEVSRQGQVIESLKSQVLAFQQSKREELDTQSVIISQLESEIESVKQENTSAAEAASAFLAKTEREHSEKIGALQQQLNHVQEELKNATASHLTQVDESVRNAQAELSSALDELKASKSSHQSELQALKAELQKASDDAVSVASKHQEAISTLQAQLGDAKAALQEATTKSQTLTTERTNESTKAQEDIKALHVQLEAVNAALSETVSKHESLSKTHESEASSVQEELASLKAKHAEETQQLEESLQATKKEVASAKALHASQIRQLEEQMQATLKDLDSLEAGNVEAVQRAKVEASEYHQRALGEAEQAHIQRVRELEQQLNDAKSEESSAAQKLEDERKQTLKDHEQALEDLKRSNDESLAALEAQLKSAKDSAEAATAAHAEQLKLLEEDVTSRHAAMIESLKTEHTKILESIQNENKLAQESALESLTASLDKEKKTQESQALSLQADLENTRFQLQTLKGMFQSIEEEGKEKDKEHEEAIEKLQDELSMSVRKLAEQSSRVMDLQIQHDDALASFRTKLESKSQEEIETAKFEHTKALDELQTTLEKSHKQVIDRLQAEHSSTLEAAQSSTKAQIAELQRKAKEEHDEHMDEIMKTLENQWKSQVDQLEAQCAAANARLVSVTSEHDSALQQVDTEHQAALKRLELELQQAHEAAAVPKDNTDLESLKAQLAEALDQIKVAERNHAEAMAAAYVKHESALTSMKQELKAAQEVAEQRRDAAEFEELNAKFVEAQKALETLHKESERIAHETRVANDTKLEQLLIELEESKEAAKHGPDPAELDAANVGLQDARNTIASLQANLEGALQEVETQRSRAEIAQQEIQQLKHQSDAASLPSPKPRRTSRSPRRKSMNPLSPTGQKKGLESSKWATAEELATASPQTPASPSSGLRGGASDQDALDEVGADGPETEEKPSKHNVAGQLAGIQEQIRQLDEISGDFLVEHQKMARTLSRVDDQTQSSVTVEVESEDS
ncbi:uncharacterized protein A1O9_11782 [Exophiala aquamarina CBS 119918]|uniref:M protein repeat protein n=1 Tax=Exophiala aquamarina CBS 119918 TaxID=1182545 RepID=A0A072NX36_9EURO|nr:uncharacterized protein A1O9_11782 [Exophiala aquamarina CBS 119918]KEF52156.1 hypothetical protein A1O9_11782 [Exophiala aquamarina CBS 119918]